MNITNKKIAIDTAPLIYYIEEHSEYITYLLELFENTSTKNNIIITSVLTLLEVLVLPYRNKNYKLAKKYENILEQSSEIQIYDITITISKLAAKLRAQHNLRTPDSLQIASAIHSNADLFLTNDYQLKKVTEIDIIILDEEIKKSIG